MAACTRRDILKAAPVGLAFVALVGSLAPRAAAAQQKVAKAMVQYQDKPKDGHQCSGCSNFVAPGSCRVVEGSVSPVGWCSIWTPKPK